jgi:Tfp pilus assembly protein PilX
LRLPLRRPDLRVVALPARTVKRRRRTMVLAGVLGLIALLTVVGFQVVLAQSQIAIDHIDARNAAAERRYEDARLRHAQLSSPERITNRANELGLVAPAQPPTVVPVTGAVPTPPDAASTTLKSWTDVKPTLGSTP